MSSPYLGRVMLDLGQVMLVSFGYAPKGWAQCNGATLPINQYQALFSLLGTAYGGNGITPSCCPICAAARLAAWAATAPSARPVAWRTSRC